MMDVYEMAEVLRTSKKTDAVVLWCAENRASIVPISRVLDTSAREEGRTTLVKWGKSKSYQAKILKISDDREVLQDFLADCLIGTEQDRINSNGNIAQANGAKKRPATPQHSDRDSKHRKSLSDQHVSKGDTNKTQEEGKIASEKRLQVEEKKQDKIKKVHSRRDEGKVSSKKQNLVSDEIDSEEADIESDTADTPSASAKRSRCSVPLCRPELTSPPCSITTLNTVRKTPQLQGHREQENQAVIIKLRKEIAANAKAISHLEKALDQERDHSAHLEAVIRDLKSSSIPDEEVTPDHIKFLDRLSGILKHKMKRKKDLEKDSSRRSITYHEDESFTVKSNALEQSYGSPITPREKRIKRIPVPFS